MRTGVCESCSGWGPVEMDHIVPTGLGGPDDASNFQWLCPLCHDIKTRFEDMPAIMSWRYGQAFHKNYNPLSGGVIIHGYADEDRPKRFRSKQEAHQERARMLAPLFTAAYWERRESALRTAL